MARPMKNGLDYFPFDCDFFTDKKIRRLKTKYGRDGICVYIYLLCKVYGDKGYYLECDDDLILDMADDLGISEELTRQIMKYLVSRSLLCVCPDGEEENGSKLVDSVTILSAKSIQRRYIEAKRNVGSKRDVFVEARYWLLEKAETPSFIKVHPHDSKSVKNEGLSVKNSLKESKVNESKGKESRVEESMAAASTSQGVPHLLFVSLTRDQYAQLTARYPKHIVDDYIQRVDDYAKSKGRGYPDYAVVIARWIDQDVKSGKTSLSEPSYNSDEWGKMVDSFDPSML